MNTDDKKQFDRITALTSEVVDTLLPELGGPEPMAWEDIVCAAAMAIKGVGMLAGQIQQLSPEETRLKLISAVSKGMSTQVKAVLCKSQEEYDELRAAQEAQQEGSVH